MCKLCWLYTYAGSSGLTGISRARAVACLVSSLRNTSARFFHLRAPASSLTGASSSARADSTLPCPSAGSGHCSPGASAPPPCPGRVVWPASMLGIPDAFCFGEPRPARTSPLSCPGSSRCLFLGWASAAASSGSLRFAPGRGTRPGLPESHLSQISLPQRTTPRTVSLRTLSPIPCQAALAARPPPALPARADRQGLHL